MSNYDPNQPRFSGQPIPPEPPKKPMSKEAKIGWGVLAALGAIALVGSTLFPGRVNETADTVKPSPVVTSVGPSPEPVITPTNKPTQPAKPTAPPKVTHKPAPALTAAQEQAIGSAQDYLDTSHFSRKGLIDQLEFEGFTAKDATFAVDYLKVNWNEQAAKKAKEYLSMQHFSRSGLIKQLESAYGEQFTHAQAVYGVTKAGL